MHDTMTTAMPPAVRDPSRLNDNQRLERTLRELIYRKRDFIYNGDSVVSEDVDGHNPNPGRSGIVMNVQACMQYERDPDRLVYTIREASGREFPAWGYTLRRTSRAQSNIVLEEMLRTTNTLYEMERELEQ